MRRLLCCLVVSLVGCSKPAPAEVAPPPVAAPASPGHVVLPAAPADDRGSLYDLSLTMEDQDGKSVPFDVYRGQPVLISMFYTSCTAACPMLINGVDRLLASLDERARAETRVLLVSFDPEHDTIAALRATAERHHLDLTRWKMARVPEPKVRELAAILGIKYRNLADGNFNHSSVITLLDGEGRLLVRSDGLAQAPAVIGPRLAAVAATTRTSRGAR